MLAALQFAFYFEMQLEASGFILGLMPFVAETPFRLLRHGWPIVWLIKPV